MDVDYFKPACPFCGYSLTGLRGSACPECGRSLLGRGGAANPRLPLRTTYISVGVILLIASMVGTVMGRGGITGFLLVLPSAAAPFVIVLLLVRFVSGPRSVFEGLFLSLPPSLTITGFLLYWFHDAMVVHPGPQGALVYVVAPIYSVPYAIGAWLAAFLVLLLVRSMA